MSHVMRAWLSKPYPYTNPFATGPDADEQTRRLIRDVIFALFLLGGVTIACNLVLPVPGLRGDGARWTVAALAVAMLAIALYTRFARNVPDRWYLLACYLSLPIISVDIAVFDNLRPAPLFLMWPAMAGAFFGQWRECCGGWVFGMACYAIALFGFSPEPYKADWFVYVVCATAVAMLLVYLMKVRAVQLIARLDQTARTDALTGILNRGAFGGELELALDQASAAAEPVTVISLDLDHFKQVNDLYGHAAGDDALRAVTGIISSAVPDGATFARVGGEEFAVLLVGAEAGEAMAFAERLRDRVEAETAGHEPSLTVSIGVASFPEAGDTPSAILLGADRALYAAKQAGRNCVIAADDTAVRLLDVSDRRRAIESEAGAQTALRLAERLDAHRYGASDRSREVGQVAAAIAEELGLPADQTQRVGLAGTVRDVGMLGVPVKVLDASHALTPEERELVERHVEIGLEVLAACGLEDLGPWVSAHHERVDGSGYPHGLAGAAIPLPARIIAVAEAFCSLTHGPGVSPAVAVAELRECAASQFDDGVVEALSRVLGVPSGAARVA